MSPKSNRIKTAAFATAALITASLNAPMAFAQDAYSNDGDNYPTTTTQAGNTGGQVVLDPGTVLPVLLNTELTSNNSNVGDTFTASIDTSRSAYNSLLRGATVDGIVRHASPQSGSDPGTLDLAFTRLRLPNGETYPISGTVTSLDNKNLHVKSDGTLQAVKTNKDQSLTYAGIGAGAGALINVLGGGKLRIEDLLLGGGLGYAAGQLLKGTQKVGDVDLKPGTPVGVLLGQRVRYHRIAPSVSPVVTPILTRTPTVQVRPSGVDNGRRYYSYLGHPYYLDLKTGKRIRLDQ